MKSIKELCLLPEIGAGFNEERLRGIEETLAADARTDLPWYLRVIVGIGAWLSSLFFLAFAGAFIGWRLDRQTGFGIAGIVILIIVAAAGRRKTGVFMGQCALAVSLAAQAMIYLGFAGDGHHLLGTITLISVVLAPALYFAYPNFVSQLLTCFVALQFILFWIYAGSDGDPFGGSQRIQPDFAGMVWLYWAVQLAATCWCFLRPGRPALLAPLGYALVLSLAAWKIEDSSHIWTRSVAVRYSAAWLPWMLVRIRPAATALTILGVSLWAAGGVSAARWKAPPFIGMALILAALAALGSGGTLLALLFVLLGFSLQSRPLLVFGLLLLPVFLTHYYYNLNLDLMAKAGVLIGSGTAILLARSGFVRWASANPGEAV